jgi:FG-GAP-like repeat/FG-GAP repeat
MRRYELPARRSRRAWLRRAGLAVASCFVFGLLAAGAGAADPVFVQAAGSPLGAAGPHSVAAADFDRNGKVDLAIANETSDDISIRLGNGAGGFGAPTSVPVGDMPLGLAVADLNRDGKLDIAVASAGSDDLRILLGNGRGGFAQSGAPIPLADAPWYVVLGDVDRDRRVDAVISHVGSGMPFVSSQHVSVLLGNGAGGFTQAVGSPITVGRTPYGVEIADFDGDRNPDLAIANQFEDFVSILLGDGTGQFTPAQGSPIHFGAGGPTWLVVGNFDDDRDADLAVALASGSVRVLLGDGTGGFAPAPGSPIALPGRPHNLRAADFDRDGELDLGVDRLGSPGLGVPPSFSVLLGDGEGGFQLAGTPNPVGTQPFSMAVGDFNGDRKPDVAVGNYGGNSVSILLNATTTPAEAIAALRKEVWASGLGRGLRVSLTAKLLVAELTAGLLENRPACAALDAFVAEAEARKGSSGLTEAVAEGWIEDAGAIRADLGCAG